MIEEEDNFPDQDELDKPILAQFDFKSFQLKTLNDLVLLGIAFRELSGAVVVDLIDELRKLDIKEMPVLLAVDQYNAWLGESVFQFQHVPVMAMDVCVPRSLGFLDKKRVKTDAWHVKNGLCVAALSMKHPENDMLKNLFENERWSVPLLVRVPNYSQVYPTD